MIYWGGKWVLAGTSGQAYRNVSYLISNTRGQQRTRIGLFSYLVPRAGMEPTGGEAMVG